MDATTRRHDGTHGDDCFGCKVQSVQIDPRALPSRRNTVAPRPPQNNWERGIWRDERGLPVRKENGTVIGLKELEDNPRLKDRLTLTRQGVTAAREHVSVPASPPSTKE